MTNKERKAKGLPYHYDDPSLMGNQFEYQDKLYEYNRTRPTEQDRRQKLLKEMFAEIGEGCHVEIPLNANWGGHHVHFGQGIYCNSNVTFVDDEHIYVGDYTMIAPNVVISTSGHPELPILREKFLQRQRIGCMGIKYWSKYGNIFAMVGWNWLFIIQDIYSPLGNFRKRQEQPPYRLVCVFGGNACVDFFIVKQAKLDCVGS